MRTVEGVGRPNSIVGKEMRQRDNSVLGDKNLHKHEQVRPLDFTTILPTYLRAILLFQPELTAKKHARGTGRKVEGPCH